MGQNFSENNICFVANYSKTFLFDAVAKCLEDNGIGVFWIVVNRKLRDYLATRYKSDSILYLGKGNATKFSKAVGNFRLNELVCGDRALRYQAGWAYSFLNNIQKPIYDFLSRHKVRYIFGEVTWAHEILIHRLVSECSELEAQYLCPHTIRMPAGRFGFFKDEFQSELVPVSLGEEEEVIKKPSHVKIEKPDYLALNDNRLKSSRTFYARLNRLKRYLTKENIDSADPTLINNRLLSFKLRAAEEINREVYYHLVPKVPFDDELAKKDFVFLALHKQPEASIDVIGRYYEDQYTNIHNVWRALPDDWWLVVKEHTNAVGDRSWGFYRKLRRLRNVLLVDEKADSHQLIGKSRGVITVSGTVAYEAALMGKPAMTFGEVFFNQLDNCLKIGLEDFRNNTIYRLLESVKVENSGDFSSWLLNHSAEGIISDPISNPLCMSDDNIKKVAQAIILLANINYDQR